MALSQQIACACTDRLVSLTRMEIVKVVSAHGLLLCAPTRFTGRHATCDLFHITCSKSSQDSKRRTV